MSIESLFKDIKLIKVDQRPFDPEYKNFQQLS